MSLFIKTAHILKACLVLTNKSIKNLLTKSKQLRVQLIIFLTNKSFYLADCPKLHLIKVQLHMAPVVITTFITKHQLAPWWGSNTLLSSNNTIISTGRSTIIFDFSLSGRSPIFR